MFSRRKDKKVAELEELLKEERRLKTEAFFRYEAMVGKYYALEQRLLAVSEVMGTQSSSKPESLEVQELLNDAAIVHRMAEDALVVGLPMDRLKMKLRRAGVYREE